MVASDLIWYSSVDIFHDMAWRPDRPRSSRGSNVEEFKHLPGFDTFKHIFNYFAYNLSVTDRTGTLKLPVKTQVLPQCILPEFQHVGYDFDTLCQTRARYLLDHAINTGRKLVVTYSGGIDSTLIMVSLFKVSTEREIRDHVLVLLSDMSVTENPGFYKNYISKLCKMESSHMVHRYQGNDDYVVVNGEGGDQLFGSAVSANIIADRGVEFLFSRPSSEKIIDLMANKIPDLSVREKLVENLNKLVAAAPIEIPSIFHYFWWFNFTCKWQSVYTRSMAYTNPRYSACIKPEDNYFSFYITPEMQLWSMNNTDKLIKDNWVSYKYHCKDIIYDFDGDADYRDYKMKIGSLAFIVNTRSLAKAIDVDMTFYFDRFPDPVSIWNLDNDFI